MTRVAVVIVIVGLISSVQSFGSAQRTSRASTVVNVPVTVRDGSRPLTGLTAADVVVTDNDVIQQVQLFAVESMPIDVTLVVDTSESSEASADRLGKDVQQIARLLRPSDDLRVVTVDTYVVAATTAGKGASAIEVPRQNGASSVHDALIAALVKPVAADRRHLIVAILDVLDTMSYTTADRVREVAARSDALLEIVTVRPARGYRSPYSFVRPRYNDESTLILSEAAEHTGGALRGRGLFGDSDPVSAFKRALDDFRQSYVLRYSPRDVELQGWHELAVTVPKAPNATIRARKGYYGS